MDGMIKRGAGDEWVLPKKDDAKIGFRQRSVDGIYLGEVD